MKSALTILLFMCLSNNNTFAQENVLLVQNIYRKEHYIFFTGNKIKLRSFSQGRIKGRIEENTDSTIKVNSHSFPLQKIKRPSKDNTYTQVIAGVAVADGLILTTANPAMQTSTDGSTLILGNLAAPGLSLPLLIKPGLKVGKECKLSVAVKGKDSLPKRRG